MGEIGTRFLAGDDCWSASLFRANVVVRPPYGPAEHSQVPDSRNRAKRVKLGFWRISAYGRHGCSSLATSAGPAGLVRRPEPRPVVAVEVLVEQDVVAEVRVVSAASRDRRRPAAGPSRRAGRCRVSRRVSSSAISLDRQEAGPSRSGTPP